MSELRKIAVLPKGRTSMSINFILIENQDKTVTQVELEASIKKHIGQANKSAGWMPWH